MTERFVDEAEEVIPPANTWSELSLQQLIETKTKLEDKLFTFSKTPPIAKALQSGISRLQTLIDAAASSR
jgi:hypothetical protein